MNYLLVESFYGGSHKVWADNVKSIFKEEMDMITLPDRFWKWRMEGAAWDLAKQYKALSKTYELIFVSDLINLSLFLSLCDIDRHKTKVVLYMHENQLSYPWSENDRDQRTGRDRHYGFMNIMNVIVADLVCFNSHFHMLDFANEIEPFLKVFPDAKIEFTQAHLLAKSSVLPIPLQLGDLINLRKEPKQIKTVLWNHRWEYDKHPDLFFETLIELKAKGVSFKLNVIGQKFKRYPDIFDKAMDILADEIQYFGFVKSHSAYLSVLSGSDILPICSNHDFFGISVVEAIASGCTPLLPNRLVYPEHLELDKYAALFYESDAEFKQKLEIFLNEPLPIDLPFREEMYKYDISKIGSRYAQYLSGHIMV